MYALGLVVVLALSVWDEYSWSSRCCCPVWRSRSASGCWSF